MKLNRLEAILKLIHEGKRTPEEIAKELGMRKEDVEGAMEILKAIGYIEEVQKGSPPCDTCPLRKVCGGKCFLPKVKVLRVRFDL